jgi:hypothetical protein
MVTRSSPSPAPPLHACMATPCSSPPSRNLRRRRAAQLLAPADEDRRAGGPGAEAAGGLAPRAEQERKLAVRDHGEVVFAGGLRSRMCGVLSLRGVPVHADDRAGTGDQGPAASPLPEHELALPRRRQRRDALVEGDGVFPGGAPCPRHPDEHLLAGRQRGPVNAGGSRLQGPVERAAAGDGGGRHADGAVAAAGQLPHCSNRSKEHYATRFQGRLPSRQTMLTRGPAGILIDACAVG